MCAALTANLPSWLIKPDILLNVFSNPLTSLKDVPTALSFTDNAPFLAGLRQALHWRRQLSSLASTKTVIFSLLGVRGLMLPNILEVCKALKSVCNISSIQEVFRAPNSPFIGFSFSDSNLATKFQSLFTSFESSLVVYVSAVSSLTRHFKLQGLPPLFPDSRIKHFLSKHFTSYTFTRDRIATDDHIRTPLNSVSGTVLLSPSQDPSKLPHLIPLPSPHLGNALLVLSGRPSLCLKCGGLGHTRRFCTSPKCLNCHQFHATSSSCSDTSHLSDLSMGFDSLFTKTSTSSGSSFLKSTSSFSPVASECVRTRHTSAPATLSSPVLSSSYNDQLLPASSTIVPYNTPDSLDPCLLPTTQVNSSLSTMINVANKHISYANIVSSGSSSLNSSLHNKTNSYKTSTSTKRDASTLSPPLDSHHSLSPSTSNIFTHLNDEVLSSKNTSHSASIKSQSVNTKLISHKSIAHKRTKLHTTHPSDISITPSQSVSHSPATSAPLWSDRMDSEDVSLVDAFTSSQSDQVSSLSTSTTLLLSQPPSLNVISSVSVDANCTFSSLQPPAPSSLPQDSFNVTHQSSDDNSSVDTDFEERDDDVFISISGFPVNTSYEDLILFAGKPSPSRILIKKNSKGYFFIYRADDDIDSLLLKDGHWVGNHIISVSILHTPDSS